METPLQAESLPVRQTLQRSLCLLCKFTSRINECSAALRSSGLYLRYGCSLLCRASVIVVIIEPLAFIIFSYPCWQKKKRSSHCNKELLNYDCMLSILFNCKIFKQEILTQAAVPMSCRYKIRHELEVNKLKLWITWELKPLKRAQMFFFCF